MPKFCSTEPPSYDGQLKAKPDWSFPDHRIQVFPGHWKRSQFLKSDAWSEDQFFQHHGTTSPILRPECARVSETDKAQGNFHEAGSTPAGHSSRHSRYVYRPDADGKSGSWEGIASDYTQGGNNQSAFAEFLLNQSYPRYQTSTQAHWPHMESA